MDKCRKAYEEWVSPYRTLDSNYHARRSPTLGDAWQGAWDCQQARILNALDMAQNIFAMAAVKDAGVIEVGVGDLLALQTALMGGVKDDYMPNM